MLFRSHTPARVTTHDSDEPTADDLRWARLAGVSPDALKATIAADKRRAQQRAE